MKYSSNKDINQVVRKLIRVGWHFQHRGKHNEICSPDGEQRIIFSVSPSDRRSYFKFKRDLKKYGFVDGRRF